MFEQAIDLDPQFADAYAYLSGNYWYEFWFGWGPDPGEALDRAFEYTQQALALDNSQIVAHHVVGTIYMLRRQYEAGIAALEQAIALSPNDADGYYCLGGLLLVGGRSEEAIGLVEQAMRLNPRYPASYLSALGQAYHLTGQEEKALATFERTLARAPHYLVAQLSLTILYSELDRNAEAQAAAAEVLRIDPDFSVETAERTLFSAYKDQAKVGRWMSALRRAGLE